MHLSISVTDFGAGHVEALVALARAADEAGLDTLWVPDHLLQVDPSADVDGPMFEAYTLLGFLAGQTSSIRLGTMVTAATYRPASLLVKAVTSLDVLSGGRAWLGIGSGYQHDEAEAMELPLPARSERFERLEDTVRLAKHMWSQNRAPFDGYHVHAKAPTAVPASTTRPAPPILIGGMGERRTLRLVAEHADACNLFDIPDGGRTVRRKLAVLDRHCAAVGRPPGEIERTINTRLGADETASQFKLRCDRFAELGIDHVVVLPSGPWRLEHLETIAAARALA